MGPVYMRSDREQPSLSAPVNPFEQPAVRFGSSSPQFRDQMTQALVNGGVFSLPVHTGTPLDTLKIVPKQRTESGEVVLWKTEEVMLASPRIQASGAIDSVRMTIGAVSRLPGGLVMGPDLETAHLDLRAFDLSYTRGWPSALTFKAGAYDLDLSPHAGLGMSNAGGSAEAGAMVRFGSKLDNGAVERLVSGLGIHAVDGATYGDQGRWYLFAAASGRALGLNMTRDNKTGDMRRSGWSIDPSTALIGDSQVGLGWRKGSMQASVGYLYREVKNEFGVRGADLGGDSRVAFSLTIHPATK
jgi:hypothetical protein